MSDQMVTLCFGEEHYQSGGLIHNNVCYSHGSHTKSLATIRVLVEICLLTETLRRRMVVHLGEASNRSKRSRGTTRPCAF